ncbi:hypothetical protein QJQ45_008946 [Haematococcus lacustris]|nr:hypothetical protein QJQ45_008946 [Haematococcus lacustris]
MCWRENGGNCCVHLTSRAGSSAYAARISGQASAASASPLATSLLDLPVALLQDIASVAVQLGAGDGLSRTCRAFSEANLRHAPAFRIQLDTLRCNQLLTPRVVAALQARTSKLTLTLQQTQPYDSSMYTKQLNYALSKLGSCPAVHVYKLEWSRASCNDLPMLLDCTPGLAQCLVASFPGLTALSLDGYSVTCSGLASLLSHPQLALQLQQLDLTRTTISQPKRPEPGAVTLDTLFCGVRLKQLGAWKPSTAPLPNLQPLAQHLTQLSIGHGSVIPSLEFWRQLVLLMPSVTQVTLSDTQGAATVAMHKCLRLMAEQPWARWLDITIVRGSSKLAPCWRTNSLSRTGKFRVCMKVQPSPAQPSPAQPSPAQPSPAQPSPAQPSPAQPSPASPAQPSPAQPSPAQPSPAQPSPAQPSPAQPSPAQPSPAQPSPAQPSPAQPSPAQPSPAQPSPAQPSPAQPSPAQPSPAQPSPAQPSPAQPSPAQPSPAQPSPAQPSPAQPSPAQPSPAQPSPAQPSPAQPSHGALGIGSKAKCLAVP